MPKLRKPKDSHLAKTVNFIYSQNKELEKLSVFEEYLCFFLYQKHPIINSFNINECIENIAYINTGGFNLNGIELDPNKLATISRCFLNIYDLLSKNIIRIKKYDGKIIPENHSCNEYKKYRSQRNAKALIVSKIHLIDFYWYGLGYANSRLRLHYRSEKRYRDFLDSYKTHKPKQPKKMAET